MRKQNTLTIIGNNFVNLAIFLVHENLRIKEICDRKEKSEICDHWFE